MSRYIGISAQGLEGLLAVIANEGLPEDERTACLPAAKEIIQGLSGECKLSKASLQGVRNVLQGNFRAHGLQLLHSAHTASPFSQDLVRSSLKHAHVAQKSSRVAVTVCLRYMSCFQGGLESLLEGQVTSGIPCDHSFIAAVAQATATVSRDNVLALEHGAVVLYVRFEISESDAPWIQLAQKRTGGVPAHSAVTKRHCH